VTGTGAVSSVGTDSESHALGLMAGWSLSEALGSRFEEVDHAIGWRVTSRERKDELHSTLRRSPETQRTWSKAHDSAVEAYGEGERAHRTAFAALKRTPQKVGDHWEPKDGAGPSDERAASGVDPQTGRGPSGKTAGGVNVNVSKQELLETGAHARRARPLLDEQRRTGGRAEQGQ
jgi:hypothetical protein